MNRRIRRDLSLETPSFRITESLSLSQVCRSGNTLLLMTPNLVAPERMRGTLFRNGNHGLYIILVDQNYLLPFWTWQQASAFLLAYTFFALDGSACSGRSLKRKQEKKRRGRDDRCASLKIVLITWKSTPRASRTGKKGQSSKARSARQNQESRRLRVRPT